MLTMNRPENREGRRGTYNIKDEFSARWVPELEKGTPGVEDVERIEHRDAGQHNLAEQDRDGREGKVIQQKKEKRGKGGTVIPIHQRTPKEGNRVGEGKHDDGRNWKGMQMSR